jgi:uncharacterized 2Fe-2S/4Fe-4S cluster protein (DUF4445 family)
MAKYKVTFLPEYKEVEVDEDTTLLEAAGKAGVYINSLCGGEGLCGECRVQVISGNARADKHAIGFFSKEEVINHYVLACQTPVESDMVIQVPAKSRLELEKIITGEPPLTYCKPGKVALHRQPCDPASMFDPLVAKLYLQLPQPSTDDNIADIDRVTRELRKKLSYSSYEISLACLQGLTDKLRNNDWKVTATVAKHNSTGRLIQIEAADTTIKNYGIAVDVGTTTVVVQLVNLKNGEVAGVEANHNLQARYGEDVISRMIFACGQGSLDPLHQAIITNINGLTRALTREKGINVKDIYIMVAAGNTTMSHFLLGLMPCSIRLEPYVPTAAVYPQITAKEIGVEINPNAIVEVMPSVSSYVGGDTVAGILACGLADRPGISCLVDVGTNAEIVLGGNEWLVCCSASAGPAFEGGGAKWGMHATKGAIEKLQVIDGNVRYETIGGARPRGICGSGLIDCIYELVRNRIIGQDGKFSPSSTDKRVIMEADGPQYILAYPEETETGKTITITESDIGNLIKSKGAVFAALKSLVDYVGLSFDKLEMIYLAGGFGSSLDVSKAISIGLLPDVNKDRVQFIGNSSIMGARMAMLSGPAFEKGIAISKNMTNIELSRYVPFMNEFVAALFLPHTDSKLFPSVKY